MKKTELVVRKRYSKHYINPRPRKMTPERLAARTKIAAAILLYEMQLEQESND